MVSSPIRCMAVSRAAWVASPPRAFNAPSSPWSACSRHRANRYDGTPSSRDSASSASPRRRRSTTSRFRATLHRWPGANGPTGGHPQLAAPRLQVCCCSRLLLLPSGLSACWSSDPDPPWVHRFTTDLPQIRVQGNRCRYSRLMPLKNGFLWRCGVGRCPSPKLPSQLASRRWTVNPIPLSGSCSRRDSSHTCCPTSPTAGCKSTG